MLSQLTLCVEILITVPLGYASDRYGRKIVLVLNNIAVLLAFSWVMLVGQFELPPNLRLAKHMQVTPITLSLSKQLLSRPFSTFLGETSMWRQQTCMPLSLM